MLHYAVGIARPNSRAWCPSCRHHARRCACDTLLDPFAGIGGNVIQMAATCRRVIAGELSPERTSLIRHNANVYGAADRIEARCCDFWDSSAPAEVSVPHTCQDLSTAAFQHFSSG